MRTDGKLVKRLPTRISTYIGRICYAYSILEQEMRDLVYFLLDIDPKRGRLAVRDARGKEMIDLIRDLIVAHGNKTDATYWQALRNDVEKLSTERDKLAHGIWLRYPESKQIKLRVTRGNWPKSHGKASRKMRPQSMPYTAKTCAQILGGISQATRHVAEIHKQARAVRRASQRKALAQLRKGRPRHTRKRSERRPQPQSSGE